MKSQERRLGEEMGVDEWEADGQADTDLKTRESSPPACVGKPSGMRLILKAWELEAPGTCEDGV